MASKESKKELVLKHIKNYPDFPKKGILFRDIFSVLANSEASSALHELIFDHCDKLRGEIQAVAALESRGFLFGPQIALRLGVPFVPIRKPGKLPGEIIKMSYELEYGSDILEIQKESVSKGDNILLVDDLLATGGSLSSACKLITALSANVFQCFVIMELEDLNGRKNVPAEVHSLLQL